MRYSLFLFATSPALHPLLASYAPPFSITLLFAIYATQVDLLCNVLCFSAVSFFLCTYIVTTIYSWNSCHTHQHTHTLAHTHLPRAWLCLHATIFSYFMFYLVHFLAKRTAIAFPLCHAFSAPSRSWPIIPKLCALHWHFFRLLVFFHLIAHLHTFCTFFAPSSASALLAPQIFTRSTSCF